MKKILFSLSFSLHNLAVWVSKDAVIYYSYPNINTKNNPA